MTYLIAYITEDNQLCLRPADPKGEEDLKEWLPNFKREPHKAVDVETQMAEDQYQNYKQNMQRWGHGGQGGELSPAIGFNINPIHAGMYPPEPPFNPYFNPQSHFGWPGFGWHRWGGWPGFGWGYSSGFDPRSERGGNGQGNEQRGGEYDGRDNPRNERGGGGGRR